MSTHRFPRLLALYIASVHDLEPVVQKR